MAASQARLLTITARQHDVEYQAQSIQNAKVQLSTQQDRVYQEYQAALDATTLTINAIDEKSGAKSIIAATFNNLFSSNRLRAANGEEYALFDSKGRLVVEDEIYQQYYNFVEGHTGIEQNPYTFAMFMIFGSDFANEANANTTLMQAQTDAYIARASWADETTAKILEETRAAILNLLGVTEDNGENDSILYIAKHPKPEDVDDPCYEVYPTDPAWEHWTEADWEEYERLLQVYEHALYSTNLHNSKSGADTIYKHLYSSFNNVAPANVEESIDTDKFNYYMHIFKMIQSCGGCVSIDDFNGFNGDAKTDSEWLTSMIQSGLMTISTIKEDKEGKINYNGTSPSSDSSISYTTTTTIDSRALKKAEAKYEHDLKEIDRKDKKFDMDLSKLDTERNALKTQYDSVKKIIEDNIDRTFGIFS